ncbi:toxin TcdB middle/N-terminal domain-containing protein [Corallococcus exercitus]|uniref:Insecticide toxin TcdB middle/N-terminal domain-containing protein n=1 Tax=Corallococcus exercitus TaxID=2316736 RepID=A0A7Y4JV55_9BACT|nr:toxin TcdB middle/N-terminal domain-containing protein [Corallococcus exercitus]NOK11751.1 hypothetical protein [Corallococcus exercitus]
MSWTGIAAGRNDLCFLCMVAVLAFALVVGTRSAHAEEGKSGLTANKLRLPKGPGSIEGIGPNAEPNLSMGLANYSIPIELPAGHSGLAPSLALVYRSGSGNSAVGIGWSIAGVPRIERMTSKGLPHFDQTDRFAVDGSDELVRVSDNAYRARYEQGFVRYTWFDPVKDGSSGYWMAEYPDGRKGYFGADMSGVPDPTAVVAGRRGARDGAFSYHLVDLVDALGHRIHFSYSRDRGQVYPARIAWVDTSAGPRHVVEFAYENRPDELSDGKPGVEIVTGLRVRDLLVTVRGSLLRRYHLSYEGPEQSGGLSRLQSVAIFGADNASIYPMGFYFQYTGVFSPECVEGSLWQVPKLVTMSSLGIDFATRDADLIDINGDSLPDVVDTGGTDAPHRFHIGDLRAAGSHGFAPAATSATSGTGSAKLSSDKVFMVDLNGDGFSDLIDVPNGRVLWNHGTGDWSPAAIITNGFPDIAGDAYMRFFDFDNDRIIDVVHADGGDMFYRRNNGDGTFAREEIRGSSFSQEWSFASGMRLADMNGDGMQDFARLIREDSTVGVVYRTNLGNGYFVENSIEMFCEINAASALAVELVDLNGDALSDVVAIFPGAISYCLNRAGHRLEPGPEQITHAEGGAIPADPSLSIRFADMNGSGSTDIVWIDPSGLVRYLELFPVRPNLLTRVDNGIGGITEISYGSGAAHMAQDGGPQSWRYRLPGPVTTVDRIVSYDELSGARQQRDLHYSDGFYDSGEKQFRGFARVIATSAGDANEASSRTISNFEVGQFDTYRKDLLINQTTESAGSVLSETVNVYGDCKLADVSATLSPRVRHICQTRSVRIIKEGTDPASWVELTTEYKYDGYGNRTRTADLGITKVGGGACGPCRGGKFGFPGRVCGAQCLGDERIETAEFLKPKPDGRWLLRSVLRRRVHAGDPRMGSEEVSYYDGKPYVGLPHREQTAGLLTRVSRKVTTNSGTVIDAQRFEYDADGNVTGLLDPVGNRRVIAYDEDRLLPVSEEVELDGYRLREEIAYHQLFEQPTESTAWLRVEGDQVVSTRRITSYSYDTFGRLNAIAKPGDSLTSPTNVFEYDLRGPVSRIVARSRTLAGGPLDLEAIQCFDGMGRKVQERTKIREGHYQVSGYTVYGARGDAVRSYQPYEGGAADCDSIPPAAVRFSTAAYDAIGRTIRTAYQDGDLYGTESAETMRYLPLSQVAYDSEDLDPASPHHDTPTTITSDGLGRVLRIERCLAADTSVATSFAYDPIGSLRGVADDAGNARRISSDLLGRVVRVDDPDAGRTTFEYDSAGNLVRSVDGRGVATRRSYDKANRLLSIWNEDAPSDSRSVFFYDALPSCPPDKCTNPEGSLVGTTYPLGPSAPGADVFGFDDRGRSTYFERRIGDATFVFRYAFDNADRPVASTYPDGRTIRRVLDGAGRTIAVPAYVPEVTYGPEGLPSTLVLANATQTRKAYDSRLRLASISTRDGGGTVVQSYAYGRDRVGNIERVVDGRASTGGPTANSRYVYDALYRLTEAHLDEGAKAAERTSYSYDRIDNILRKLSNLGAVSAEHVGDYTYRGGSAGPHAVTKAGGDAFEYDAAGNMVQRGSVKYEWDHLGRLQRAVSGDAELAYFAYDAGPRRVLKRETGHTSLYVSDDFEVNNGVATTYIWVGSNRVVRIEDSVDHSRPDGRAEVVTFIHHNHLGSAAVTTDVAGREVQRTEHYPYGEVRFASRGDEKYSFTGQERDRNTLLGYHLNRYYDPGLARWVSSDLLFIGAPATAIERPTAGANGYTYVGGDPTNSIDPAGLADASPVEFDPGGGHHFVPKSVTRELVRSGQISGEAAEVFNSSTTGWGKGIDPHQWSAGHAEYASAVREQFGAFAAGRDVIDASGARAFIEQIKGSASASIRSFLAPHMRVVEMIRAGESRAAIQAYWQPMRASFTRSGGFVGFAGALGNLIGKACVVLQLGANFSSMLDYGERHPNGPGWGAAAAAFGVEVVPVESVGRSSMVRHPITGELGTVVYGRFVPSSL